MKITPIKKWFAAAFIGTITACSGPTGKAVLLELKYNKGDEQTITTHINTTNNDVMSVNDSQDITFKVNHIDGNGTVHFDTEITRIQTEMNMNGETEEYDSKKSERWMNEDEKSLHEQYRDLLFVPLTVSINKRGKVVQPFQNSDGTLHDEPVVDMGNLFIVFPEQKIRVGEEWTNESKNAITGAKRISTYSITKITKNKIFISLEALMGGVGGLTKDKIATGEYILDKKTNKLIKGWFSMDMQNGGGKMFYDCYAK